MKYAPFAESVNVMRFIRNRWAPCCHPLLWPVMAWLLRDYRPPSNFHPPGPRKSPSLAIFNGCLREVSCHRLATNAGHRFICRNTSLGATGGQLWSVNGDCCLVVVNWNSWGRKLRKKKQKGGAGHEAATYVVALDVSEKYPSEVHRPLEHLELALSLISVINALAQIVVAESCAFARRIPTPCYPHFLNIFLFQVSLYQTYTREYVKVWCVPSATYVTFTRRSQNNFFDIKLFVTLFFRIYMYIWTLQNLSFSLHCCWRFKSSGMLRCLIW